MNSIITTTTIENKMDKNTQAVASIKGLQQGVSPSPLEAFLNKQQQNHSSASTLPTAPIYGSYYSRANRTSYDQNDDDDQKSFSSESNMTSLFGNFNPLEFDVDLLEDDFIESEDCEPIEYRPIDSIVETPLSVSAAIDTAISIFDGDNVVDDDGLSYYADLFTVNPKKIREDSATYDEFQDSISSEMTYADDDDNDDYQQKILITGHGSMTSLSEAFGKLTACMEQTSQSRELVKQLSQQSLVSSSSRNSLSKRRSSLSLSKHSRGGSRRAMMASNNSHKILSSLGNSSFNKSIPRATASSSYKLKSILRNELRRTNSKSNSRVTGVRPINFDLL
jgi:hypothetical protein